MSLKSSPQGRLASQMPHDKGVDKTMGAFSRNDLTTGAQQGPDRLKTSQKVEATVPRWRLTLRGMLRGTAGLLGTAVVVPYGVGAAAAVEPAGPSASPADLEAELASLEKPIYLLETAVPETFTVSGGQMSISDSHAKIGRHSLQWKYQAGSRLSVQTELHVGTAEVNQTDYFAVWLYNETAVDGDLRLEFGRGDRVDAHKDVHLDFTGWRAVWLRYSRDLDGEARDDMNRITLVAPAASGMIWIDQLVTNVSVRPDRPMPDLQVPDIAPNLSDAPNFHWLGLLTYWKLPHDPGFDSARVTQHERDDAPTIYERLLTRQRKDRDHGASALAELEQQFETFGIPDLADPEATGSALRPASVGSLVYDKQLEVIPAEYRDAVIDISHGQRLRTVWDDLGLLTARTWEAAHRDGDTAGAERGGQLVLRVMVHLLARGWAD